MPEICGVTYESEMHDATVKFVAQRICRYVRDSRAVNPHAGEIAEWAEAALADCDPSDIGLSGESATVIAAEASELAGRQMASNPNWSDWASGR